MTLITIPCGKQTPLSFIFLVFFLMHVFATMSTVSTASLEVGFYRHSCPSAERIVGETVKKAVTSNPGLAAGLIRLHFHDCFVRGCDASILLDSRPNKKSAEKDQLVNSNLRGFEVIDEAKADIEAVCPNTVSCADILAFSARDSAFQVGGFSYSVPAGRRDGTISLVSDPLQNLPSFSFNATQLVQNFAAKGLSVDEMVILSGAHSIGRARCSLVSDRLFKFNYTTSQDPSMDPEFAKSLKNVCPPPPLKSGAKNSDPKVQLDILTPYLLDNKYYVNLENNQGLLTSDQTLTSCPKTAKLVRKYAKHGSVWIKKYIAAMIHMGSIEVLTGNQGEIRRNCRAVN